jgi:methyl-accepting chemotaxis protein
MFFSNNRDIENLLKTLEEFESYIKGDLNKVELSPLTSDKNMRAIEEKILSIANHIQTEKTEDLRVFGEIMLVCEKLSDGYTNDSVTQKSSDGKINYVAYSINEAVKNISHSLEQVCDVLHEYENNDYRRSIDEELFRGGQFQELLIGINNLQKGITSRVLSAYKIGITLEHQSDILQSEVANLSRSTTEQAAAVEETAAAVEEITANINSNTNNTVEMLEAGKVLKSSASKSMTLTQDTTDTMDKIDQSTQAVYDAIKVISQISFQTNILSLNAAVEAATAGEAGKGFAVVAQEVRNLANRSADAAKTIETLMDELRAQTTVGKESSSKMGVEFQILNDNINTTLQSLDAIVTASQEQSAGIKQINQSIQNIDLATQQNASSTQNVQNIAVQTHNVANKLVDANRDVNFQGKEAVETPDEIIDSIFTNEKL